MNKKEEAQPIRVILADDHAVVRAGIRQFMERNREIQVVAEMLKSCSRVPPFTRVIRTGWPALTLNSDGWKPNSVIVT